MTESTVAVLGAGVMGCDVAFDAALHRHWVILKDLTDEVLDTARERLARTTRMAKMMGVDVPPNDDVVTRIRLVTDYDGFDDAEVVVENITENIDAKRDLFRDLRGVCRADALVGINSSCIPVSLLARETDHPENVIGMHFFNPVPVKRLVEVVRGEQTSDRTVERATDFLAGLGKRSVVVGDGPGYVSNRVLMLTINESIRVVHEGVAEARDVDTVFRGGLSHTMGPLATADLIGLDTVLDSLEVLLDCTGDPKFEPCQLLTQMVREGRLGRKTGRGFFDYPTT
jgi:3-hydroxybutyryl-CoA dehydrogenase